MRFNLTYEQAQALFAVLKIVLDEPAEDLQDKQHKMILKKVFARLRAKLECRSPRDWSVTLSDIEAVTWELFWNCRSLDPSLHYEQNMINQQIALIDKEYA